MSPAASACAAPGAHCWQCLHLAHVRRAPCHSASHRSACCRCLHHAHALAAAVQLAWATSRTGFLYVVNFVCTGMKGKLCHGAVVLSCGRAGKECLERRLECETAPQHLKLYLDQQTRVATPDALCLSRRASGGPQHRTTPAPNQAHQARAQTSPSLARASAAAAAPVPEPSSNKTG